MPPPGGKRFLLIIQHQACLLRRRSKLQWRRTHKCVTSHDFVAQGASGKRPTGPCLLRSRDISYHVKATRWRVG
jgi:hypothetical protein